VWCRPWNVAIYSTICWVGSFKDERLYKKLSCRAKHFRFGPVLDQNKQSNRFFKKFLNRTENRFKPINFGSVRFGFFPSKPVQTEIMMLKQNLDSIHSFSRECYKAYQLQTNRKQFPASCMHPNLIILRSPKIRSSPWLLDSTRSIFKSNQTSPQGNN